MPESAEEAILCAHGILDQAMIFNTHGTQQIVALVQKHTDAVIDPYAEKSAMKPHSISDSQL
jgi:hypothetical protein